MSEEQSNCCGEPLRVHTADEGTRYYECTKCGNASDPATPRPNILSVDSFVERNFEAIPTPRTDAEEFQIIPPLSYFGDEFPMLVVKSTTARQLERELAQAKALYAGILAQYAAARKDSERLDWIEANIDTATFDKWSNVNGEGIIVEKFKRGGGMVGYMEENLRAAIDAAMEGGER